MDIVELAWTIKTASLIKMAATEDGDGAPVSGGVVGGLLGAGIGSSMHKNKIIETMEYAGRYGDSAFHILGGKSMLPKYLAAEDVAWLKEQRRLLREAAGSMKKFKPHGKSIMIGSTLGALAGAIGAGGLAALTGKKKEDSA